MAIESLKKSVENEEFLKIVRGYAEENELEVSVVYESVSKDDPEHRKDVSFRLEERSYSLRDSRCIWYEIKQKERYEHEWGSGGWRERKSILSKPDSNGMIILLEVNHYSSWYTLSDDSEDQGGSWCDSTNLFLEDKLARYVFDKIKESPEM